MPTRRTVIFAPAMGAMATAFAVALRATAADTSALAFVTDIYNAYRGKEAKGLPLDDERAIRRAFEPSLAALMVKDQKLAAKRGEVGLLDFDPFVDAQDWEISDLDIAVDDTAPGKATATSWSALASARNTSCPTSSAGTCCCSFCPAACCGACIWRSIASRR